MTFKDKFPLEIEFDIDRDALLQYYRFNSLAFCVGFLLPIGLLFAWSFLHSYLVIHADYSVFQRLLGLAYFSLAGLMAGLLLGLVIYYSYFHLSSKLAAQNLRLRVEGPYLRLVSGGYLVTDRRYFFKDIHTYSIHQGPFLKRYGLKQLTFQVSVRNMPAVHLAGLVDVESVRNQLCEIDATRESEKA